MNLLMFSKGDLIASDFCEAPTVFALDPFQIQTTTWGGHTLHFPAKTNVLKYHDDDSTTHTKHSNTSLPIYGSVCILKCLQAWDFWAKNFHSNGHEQATMISVAAGRVYNQEYHQEDEYDDANDGAFSHVAAYFGWTEIDR